MMKISKKEILSFRLLHEGLNSLIYRKETGEYKTPVIIKLLKYDHLTPEQIAQFQNEYELTKDLSVRGIRKVYEKTAIDGAIALILEYIEGETLRKTFVEQRRSLADILTIAISIAQVLGDIHHANIIHKDINSRNILVNPEQKEAVIIDFGIASKQSAALYSGDELLQGTLQYISPEQTGRMNRRTDYRTDLYSFGVTLYEILTGALPFDTKDVSQLIHCHIARYPLPAHTVNPEIPKVLSDIVMKLMAKNPEDRYQSACGLKADLENCLNQLNETGCIECFALAKNDFSGKFQIPQKLYGREEELQSLISAFEWVARGTCEILMVSGPPGIGKSDFVMEIRRAVREKGGYFLWGKHDQYQYSKPYSGLLQAFDRLISQILTESPEQLAKWKENILKAVGENGWLLTEVLPRMELIIGRQASAEELASEKARHRFCNVFQSFVNAVAQNPHPLVLFIDNLQWADATSLVFLNHLTQRRLMTGAENQYLLFIGAYRDNEVSESHPLIKNLREMENEKAVLSTIHLESLSSCTVNRFVSETLLCDPAYSASLADIVYEKTAGNPFFIAEFLTSLHEENLLRPDFEKRRWQWDEIRIRGKKVCDNAAELMTQKIKELPENTQKVMAIAACIGNMFDLNTLAAAAEKPVRAALEDIRKGIEEGLILPQDENYRIIPALEDEAASETETCFEFADDRIRQASYGLIQKKQRKLIHLAVGRFRAAEFDRKRYEEKIFDIADAFNEGFQYITDKDEKIRLAELNLTAGRKAKKATAYQRAIWYLSMGIGMLPPKDKWRLYYDLALNLYTEAIEAEYLSSNFRRAEQLADEALNNVRELMEKIKIYQLRILFYTVQNKNSQALETARQALEILHIFLPDKPESLNFLDLCAAELWQGLPEKEERIAYLENLPKMDNPVLDASMRILMAMTAPAKQTQPALLRSVTIAMTAISVQHGNSPMAAFAYGWYAVLCSIYGDFDEGYRFGRLSLRISEQFNAAELKAKVIFLFNVFVRHWKEHAEKAVKPLKDVFRTGDDTGDLEYAFYGAFHHCACLFCVGGSLEKIHHKEIWYLETAENLRLEFHAYLGKIWLHTVLNLQGKTKGELSEELNMLPAWIEQNNLTPVFSVYFCRTMLLYLFGDYAGAVESGRMGEKYEKGGEGFIYLPVHYFYYALGLLASYPGADSETKRAYLAKVAAIQEKMKRWAEHAPMNFQHKYDLIEAERAKICGETFRSVELYSRAVQGAREQKYIQDQALCYEREAEFYMAMGREDFARLCMTKARDCYRLWGAEAKVSDMDKRYAALLGSTDTPARLSTVIGSSSTTRSSASLDMVSIIKASHTLSREVRLENLLDKMIRIVIENAGADKGILIEYKNNELIIQAKGEVGQDEASVLSLGMQAIPLAESGDVPVSVINYAARTQTAVVLNDAADDETYASDPYIKTHRPRSLLCMPIVHQGELSGLLYLENNLSADAFTQNRLELLEILSSQAAISMKNADLYGELEQRVKDRTHELSRALKALWGEMELAKKIQTCLLPQKPEISGYEIAASMDPADEVGGDYYDVISVGGYNWIVIGDVSGHGVTAGLVMMMVQTAIHTVLIQNPQVPPSELLWVINRVIYENLVKMDESKHMTIVVLACGRDGFFNFSGLHDDMLLWCADTRKVETIKTEGMWIGLEADISDMLTVDEFRMEKGDCLVLFSDGITESWGKDGKMFGRERLTEVVGKSGDRSASEIHAAIMDALSPYDKSDDVTLLVMKRV